MAITIREVTSKKDLNAFIYLPEKIHYPEHKNWIHPLYIDDKKFFNRKKNPRSTSIQRHCSSPIKTTTSWGELWA